MLKYILSETMVQVEAAVFLSLIRFCCPFMSKEEAKKIELFLYLIIVVVLLAALLGSPQWLTDALVQWLVSAIVGSIFSMVAAAIVEAFTSDLLKGISLTIEIRGFKFSITAFAIAVVIVKLALFHQI